jgi:hypothetical protein
MPPSDRRPAPAVLDPVVAGLVALVVYALHGFQDSLDRDPATFVYGGRQFAAGTPPYQGIFNSVGPLGDITAGVGIRLGRLVALDDLTSARLTYLLLSAACVAALSVLAREAFRSRAAGVLAPAAFLTFAGFLELASAGPREKTVMVLCLELAMLLLLRRRWWGAGVLTALATLTWQPVILPAAVAATVAILTSGLPRLRAAAAYVGGALIPPAVLVGYFAAEGALRVAWWGFVLVNVRYTAQPSILDNWHLLVTDYRWSLVIAVLGYAASLALGVRVLVRARSAGRLGDVDRAHLVFGSGALVAGLWTCYALNGGADMFVMLPFAALGVAAALLPLASRLSPVTARRLCAAAVVVAVVGGCVEAVTTRDTLLPAERRNVTRMVAAAPPGSTLLSFYAPEVPVLAHRRSPDQWQLSDSATTKFLDNHLAGGLAGYAERISRTQPALIAIGHRATVGWLQPVLDREYARLGRGQHWIWYASRTLGRPTLHHLREVNRRTTDG